MLVSLFMFVAYIFSFKVYLFLLNASAVSLFAQAAVKVFNFGHLFLYFQEIILFG